ncbi:NADP-dependent oxidoreductase [Stackebrandtia soli]|uniref:NADP-dependent oxidoreductase n=1 Tax=Stackebrandtia soli TaxID=1892856 RepID=UPI0039ECA80D
MRAIAVSKFHAEPELVDVPTPTPAPGEVLVAVAAAGLNPFDWKVADGVLDGLAEHVFPLVMGTDFAGTIEAVGDGVTRFAVGDEVYGQASRPPVGTGTYAEYVTVPQDGPIALAPRKIPMSQAAAVPTAGMTALGIVEAAGIQEYESLLIIGAAGGVGSFLTQLASAVDVRVLAAVRGPEEQRMGSLGAAVTIDTTAQPLTERIRDEYPEGVDALVDLASGRDAFAAHARLVHAGGVALSTTGAADPQELADEDIEGVNFGMSASAKTLTRLATEIDEGRLVVPIEHEVPLDQASGAITANREGRARGKTVIRL